MKQADLPKCPTCGATPEYSWRERGWGTCHGALKCPYEHHKVFQAYNAGSQDSARPLLVEKWLSLVEEQGSAKKDVGAGGGL